MNTAKTAASTDKRTTGSFVLFGVAVLLIASSYFVAQYLSREIDAYQREELLSRVQSIAILTNPADIQALTGTSTDLSSQAYLRIKKSLYDLHDANSGARFLYYMRSNGTKLYFLADSESPEASQYSPPGEIYDDTSKLELDNYTNAVTFTEGPYTDTWGTWISAYAPIWYKGNVTAIFGMDVSASKWQAQIHKFEAELFIVGGAVLGSLFCFALIVIVINKRRLRAIVQAELGEK